MDKSQVKCKKCTWKLWGHPCFPSLAIVSAMCIGPSTSSCSTDPWVSSFHSHPMAITLAQSKRTFSDSELSPELAQYKRTFSDSELSPELSPSQSSSTKKTKHVTGCRYFSLPIDWSANWDCLPKHVSLHHFLRTKILWWWNCCSNGGDFNSENRNLLHKSSKNTGEGKCSRFSSKFMRGHYRYRPWKSHQCRSCP